MLWSLAFVVVALVVVVAVVLATQQKSTVGLGTPIHPVVVTPTNIPSNGRTLGNPNATVTIDLWGDFRCTGCFDFATQGTEKSLVDNYIATGKAKLVWHDYLIIDLNRSETASRDASAAAWCAADQGKFWTMHDWLYANQSPQELASAFTKDRLSQIAQLAGLDMTQYQTCFDQGKHNDEIAAEQTSKPSDVTGTPTVFVNGKLASDFSYAGLKVAIDGALGLPTPSPSTSASGSATASASASASSSASAS
jgi:protein-disulfide isomerase